jgi:hypothetical protein
MATRKKTAAKAKPDPEWVERVLPKVKAPDGTLHGRKRVGAQEAHRLCELGWHVQGYEADVVALWADRETYEATR